MTGVLHGELAEESVIPLPAGPPSHSRPSNPCGCGRLHALAEPCWHSFNFLLTDHICQQFSAILFAQISHPCFSMVLRSLQLISAFRSTKFHHSQSVQSLSHLCSVIADSETLKIAVHVAHSACLRLALLCLHCIQGTTSRASIWFNCPSSICSKRSLPMGVAPRTQADLRPKGRKTKASGGVRHGDSYKGIISNIYDIKQYMHI